VSCGSSGGATSIHCKIDYLQPGTCNHLMYRNIGNRMKPRAFAYRIHITNADLELMNAKCRILEALKLLI
jgi:hypothetical protein